MVRGAQTFQLGHQKDDVDKTKQVEAEDKEKDN